MKKIVKNRTVTMEYKHYQELIDKVKNLERAIDEIKSDDDTVSIWSSYGTIYMRSSSKDDLLKSVTEKCDQGQRRIVDLLIEIQKSKQIYKSKQRNWFGFLKSN